MANRTDNYAITCYCDPYNSRKRYNGQPVIRRDGATVTGWVVLSGLEEEEARNLLDGVALDAFGMDASWEDDESIRDYARTIADDEGRPYEDALAECLSWYDGEGLYLDRRKCYGSGDNSLTDDTCLYRIERMDEITTEE